MSFGRQVIFTALLVTASHLTLTQGALAAGAGTASEGQSNRTEQDNRKTLAFASSLLTPTQRTELEANRASFKQSLDSEIDRANRHQDRSTQLAQFISRNLKTLQNRQKEVGGVVPFLYDAKSRLDKNPSGWSFLRPADLNRSAAQVAAKLVEIELRQKAVDQAAKLDSLAAEAYARAPSGSAGATVANIAKGLQDNPCEMSGSRTNTNPIALRNISVGMSRDEIFSAVCGSGSAVRAFQTTGIGTNLLSLGSKVPASSVLSLCFDCDDGKGRLKLQGADRIQVSFDAKGRSIAVRRALTFYGPPNSSGNSSTQPYKLGLLLDPMEAKLGKPSFIYNDGLNTRVGWVYQSGKAPLAQNFWYYEKIAYNKGALQIDAAPQATSGLGLRRQQLQRLNPQASYCISKYLIGLPRDEAGVSAFFEYGTTEQSDDRMKDYQDRLRRYGLDKVNLPKGPMPYDPKYEAAGKTDRCGTIVFAKFKKNDHVDFDIQPVPAAQGRQVDRNANIYSITMDLIDTNAIEAGIVARNQSQQRAIATEKANVEREASIPSKAFVP